MQDVKLDDLHSDKSIKRAEQFTDLWTCPFVWTHTDFIQAERINSKLTSPNKLGRRPATDKRRLSVAQLGLLTSDHRTKESSCVCGLRADLSWCHHCCELADQTASSLYSPGEGKLVDAIRRHSFNTYQKFILHCDLSTSQSCVGNIYLHFSWMTMTETPTVNHLRRWNPRLCWGNGHSGKGIYFDAITRWKWHMQFQELP